jgi:hypothetical protein
MLLSDITAMAHSLVTGYIGDVEIIDDRRAGKVVVNLIGRLNKCGVISPRFDVGLKDIEKWSNNLLPSRQFGKLVLTTSAGLFQYFFLYSEFSPVVCISPDSQNLRNHGPQRGSPQEHWWQDLGLLLLKHRP